MFQSDYPGIVLFSTFSPLKNVNRVTNIIQIQQDCAIGLTDRVSFTGINEVKIRLIAVPATSWTRKSCLGRWLVFDHSAGQKTAIASVIRPFVKGMLAPAKIGQYKSGRKMLVRANWPLYHMHQWVTARAEWIKLDCTNNGAIEFRIAEGRCARCNY